VEGIDGSRKKWRGKGAFCPRQERKHGVNYEMTTIAGEENSFIGKDWGARWWRQIICGASGMRKKRGIVSKG